MPVCRASSPKSRWRSAAAAMARLRRGRHLRHYRSRPTEPRSRGERRIARIMAARAEGCCTFGLRSWWYRHRHNGQSRRRPIRRRESGREKDNRDETAQAGTRERPVSSRERLGGERQVHHQEPEVVARAERVQGRLDPEFVRVPVAHGNRPAKPVHGLGGRGLPLAADTPDPARPARPASAA